jgi:hypothetical protein
MSEHVNPRHRDTIAKIFSHPSSGNLEWREVRALLESLGGSDDGNNGKIGISLGGESEVFTAPRGKDVDQQTIVDLRRMLTAGGYAPPDTA